MVQLGRRSAALVLLALACALAHPTSEDQEEEDESDDEEDDPEQDLSRSAEIALEELQLGLISRQAAAGQLYPNRLSSSRGHHYLYQQAALHRARHAIGRLYPCIFDRCSDQMAACVGFGQDCLLPFVAAVRFGGNCSNFLDDLADDCRQSDGCDARWTEVGGGGPITRQLLSCTRQQCAHSQTAHPLYSVHSGLVSADELDQIRELKQAAALEAAEVGIGDEVHEFRNFGDSGGLTDKQQEKLGIGHRVTFVHRVFERNMPQLLQRLKQAAFEADVRYDWGLSSQFGLTADDFHVRNAEFIEYDARNLQWQVHQEGYRCSKAGKTRELDEFNTSSIMECQARCERVEGCKAVDLYLPGGSAFDLTTADHTPVRQRSESSSSSGRCTLLDGVSRQDSTDQQEHDPNMVCYRMKEHQSGQQIGVHNDGGSLLSLSVALTDPSEYGGGGLNFITTCLNSTAVARPKVGAVTIWPSANWHGVSPVVRGKRDVFVLEFWEFCSGTKDRVIGRPTHKVEWECGKNKPKPTNKTAVKNIKGGVFPSAGWAERGSPAPPPKDTSSDPAHIVAPEVIAKAEEALANLYRLVKHPEWGRELSARARDRRAGKVIAGNRDGVASNLLNKSEL